MRSIAADKMNYVNFGAWALPRRHFTAEPRSWVPLIAALTHAPAGTLGFPRWDDSTGLWGEVPGRARFFVWRFAGLWAAAASSLVSSVDTFWKMCALEEMSPIPCGCHSRRSWQGDSRTNRIR